ncbi:hypothetical protein ACF0H5_000962 [Mactra antiquata]
MNTLQSLVFGAVVATVFCACPDGWRSFQQKCYFFSTGKGDWTEARIMCGMHQSAMIEIDTPAEQAWFKSIAETYNHTDEDDGFWLGATDFVIEGKWVWETSKTAVTYVPWGAGQPNNRNGSEDCMAAVKYFDYIWSDEFCDWSHHINYVCEKAETSTGMVG